MNKQELEHKIDLLDDAVEELVEVNDRLGAEIVPDWVVENMQQVIMCLEREIRDGCEEDFDEEDDDTF